MKFLLVAKQKKNVEPFEGVITELLAQGHGVTLAIQQRDADRDDRLTGRFPRPGFELTACPEERGDGWRTVAPLVRSVADWAQYLQTPYRHATKLHRRATERLFRELGAVEVPLATLSLGAAASARLRQTLTQIEGAIPSDPLHEEFLIRHAPDVVLVTPGLHFGSGQTDFIKSARARGIPVWMLLFSWDNLSTKGALHAPPDAMFVWNERQRREAVELHGFPADRVIVTGAPRFDAFFTLKSVMSRRDFCAPLGLDPARKTILYTCSSRFIAAKELDFVTQWLRAIRSAAPPLRDCNLVVRPHPDVVLVPDGPAPETAVWPAMPQATGWVQRPFDDPAAVVLRTTYSTPQAFFECLHHADAVVALNTSAELEAGIAGRPVFTVLSTGEEADGQANTLHFGYLLREQGGFVSYASDLSSHVAQLVRSMSEPLDATAIRAFIMQFLRPHGDRSVAGILAGQLVEHGERTSANGGSPSLDVPTVAPAGSEKAVSDRPDLDRPAKCLRLGDAPGLAVYATPDTRRYRRHGVLTLDPPVVAWLNQHVRPGDVFYDIGAGVGAYTILGAVQRGALVTAFEPGFAAFTALCDNLHLNTCTRRVIPLPVALGDRAALLELEYAEVPGGDRHTLRRQAWQPGRDSVESRYSQPVCAERLDDLVQRHRLPPPNVLRIALRRGADRVLDGARRTLRDPRVRSVLVSVKDEAQAEAVIAAVRGSGLIRSAMAHDARDGIAVHLERPPSGRAGRSAEGLRRVAQRIRRLW